MEKANWIFYFIPSVCAVCARKVSRVEILLLNIALGWIFGIWCILFIWSLFDNYESDSKVHL